MELENKANVPTGFPYAGKVFIFQNLAQGQFVTINGKALTATGSAIDKFCLFQFVALPTNEVKIFSIGKQSFVSAIGAGWPLLAAVEDDSWSRFTIDYISSIGAFTIKSTQPIAANSAYVSAADASKNLKICEATPREGWSYFQPFLPTGVPATKLDQFMP